MNTPVLSVRDLVIDFEGRPAQPALVQGVNFDVLPGQSVALIGESGCGKTLTSLAILGLLPPRMRVASGSIVLGGVDVLRASERKLRDLRGRTIGAIFQEPMSSLNPTMTVGDQIGESRRLHLGESRRSARVKAVELLDRVGIPNAGERARAYPHELSGGMQQRVMIAAAIACDPAIVLADEPTTALDATVQADILQLLEDLRKDLGLGILFVTHDLGVVADFCEQVVVMYAGHVVERAGTDALFGTPRHPYTEALLGAVPQAGRARTMLSVVPGRVPPSGSLPEGCRFRPRCGYALEPCRHAQHGNTSDVHFTFCDRVADGDLVLGSKS
ncbi:ABC transporter ATP-binding protein [Amycolatopsis pigmentata]|uniref:ABC transporter ATP-binding protein n=1 Tax=Amycolatopsis pigmentata TaxID=450801 RepID=A0ABW5FNW3_9PSEU